MASGKLNQVHTAFAAALGSFIMGLLNVWPSYTAPQLKAENTTLLSTPLTDFQVPLLGSLPSLGAMIGTGVVGLIINKFGRKIGGLAICIPYVLSWTIIEVSRSSMLILAARFISGVGGGAFLAYAPIFISEVAEASIRGALASFPMIAYGLGLLVSYTIGWFFSYHIIIWFNILMSVLVCLLLFTVKESPTFLVRAKRDEEARVSLAAYRGVSASSMVVFEELASLKAQLMPAVQLVSINEDPVKSEDGENQKLKLENDAVNEEKPKMSPLKQLFTEPASRRAFTVLAVVITNQVFMGMVPVQVYAKSVFNKADPANADLYSVVFALVFLGGCTLSAVIADLAGRKILIILSSVSLALCLVTLGLQMQIKFAPDWVTVFIVMAYCFCFMCGAGSIPYVLLTEIFSPEVQNVASMIIIEWVWFTNFLIIGIFPLLIKLIGMHGIFFTFAGVSILNAALAYIMVPETKGLTSLQIQDLFLRRKK
ncbi:facilitated trehalose transporter Tret1-like [Plodia interpunctella]|uniref:facilitated trehalose transporter Tret1-like n=1 Tax=Plodia interpunctella TaxID=58824 RepID=UPI002367A8BD|nr:facilitated trehalose transporter Tret1-like [Plodia interpunctella]